MRTIGVVTVAANAAANRVVERLKTIPLDKTLTMKRFWDMQFSSQEGLQV